jgi:hypothetical protein
VLYLVVGYSKSVFSPLPPTSRASLNPWLCNDVTLFGDERVRKSSFISKYRKKPIKRDQFIWDYVLLEFKTSDG